MINSIIEYIRHKANRGSLKSKARLGAMYFEGIETKRDLRKAFELFRASRRTSDLAQFYIGEYYYKGYLFRRNYSKAFQIFQSISQQNPKNPLAIKRLADCYFHGRGVERDVLLSLRIYYNSVKVGGSAAKNCLHSCFKKKDKDKHLLTIIQIIEKKAEEGDGFLQNIRGIMYQEGNGVEKNKEVAFQWFKKSAKNNETTGMNNLAIAFHNGKGVKKNLTKSFKWFKRAAKLGFPSAVNNVGVCYLNGEGTEKDLEMAYKWFNRSLENGNILSCNSVGYMLLMGETIERDPKKAIKLFFKGDQLGNVNCTLSIGYCYTSSDGLPKDDEKAFQYFLKAAEQKDDQSMFNVGICYQQGQGIEPNPKKAIQWIKRAAEMGMAAAMNSLGVSYEFGQDLKRDPKQALSWYRQSAEKEDRFGQFNLGRCYLDGCGTKKNLQKGYKYISKARDNGVEQANEALQGLNKLQFLIKGWANSEQKLDNKILEKVIQQDYDINFQDGNTALHYLFQRKDLEHLSKAFKLFIDSGANINLENSQKTPLFYLKNEKLKNHYIQFNSLSSDFLNFLKLKENCDCSINGIKLHKLWIELRLNKTFNELEDLLKQFNKKDLNSFFIWTYSGIMDNCSITKSICKKLSIDIYQKSGRKGLVNDLKKLYKLNETKDFAILIKKNNTKLNLSRDRTIRTSTHTNKNIYPKKMNEISNNISINDSYRNIDHDKINNSGINNNNDKNKKDLNKKGHEIEQSEINFNLNIGSDVEKKNTGVMKIRVHQLILQARSDTFRGFLLNINDHKGQVGDYTGKSYKTLKTLIKFLYYDRIYKEEMDQQIIEELQDVVDYYQLNENSYLISQLHIMKKNINKNKKNNRKLFKLKKKKSKYFKINEKPKSTNLKKKENGDNNGTECVCF
ncbi:sel1-repeat-containing protein ybeq [Anaeramoeba flamelloides]|uniref:Sel1-repeat-containing protein ybeq n=1 Tax=Anaeramoeba flamelloides TaxID=1746091 RepID=A0ABQ8YG55_9EUKA|nr:sel1-repeat-containing protein ybeq [Anaeramoeba flamelloides]